MTSWTTWLEWAGLRRPVAAPTFQRELRILPFEQSPSRVPREYRALHTYLERRYASVVVLTLEQIEALLGFPLPEPARTRCEWWTDAVDTKGHCTAWTGAGRTAAPNLAAQVVRFERPE